MRKYIKAGAGSGKTYTLTKELAERIENKEVKPSQVLLTTFTNAAADEMKQRARANLLAAGLNKEAEELEQAMIGTIDSVALKYVKKYWYKLGLAVDMTELDDESKKEYVSKSLVQSVSDEDITFFDQFVDDFNVQGSGQGKDYTLWQTYLKNIIENCECFGIQDLEKSREESKKMVDLLFYAEPEKEFPEVDLKYVEDFCCIYMEMLQHIIETDSRSGPRAEKQKSAVENLLKNLKTKPSNPIGNARELFAIIEKPAGGSKYLKVFNLTEEHICLKEYCLNSKMSKEVGQRIKDYIDRIFDIVENWRKEFEDYKQANHLIDFSDMERYFVELLGMSEVCDEIAEEIKLVMVDEFQDSNALQIKIFDKLSEIAGNSIWVGDAKQAIYGFRGSDTEQTKAVSDTFTGENLQILPESWRSVPALVDFANRMFKYSFASELSPEEVELKAHRTKNIYQNPVRQWLANDVREGRKVIISTVTQFAYKIKELLDSSDNEFREKLAPRDIAVLCRKNTRIQQLVTELKSAGIPVSTMGDNILDYAEVQLVLSILKYCMDNHDNHAEAEIIHLLHDVSTEELLDERLKQAYDIQDKIREYFDWNCYQKEMEEINRIVEEIKNYSLPDKVKSIIVELDLLRKSGKWGNVNMRKDNLMSFINFVEQYDQLCITTGSGSSINGLLSYINEKQTLTADNTDENCVTVTTYHKAKGLEWNVVILDQLDDSDFSGDHPKGYTNFTYGINPVCVKSDGDTKQYYLRFIPRNLPSRKSKLIAGQETILQGNGLFQDFKQKTLKEENRLLYVGVTRAKNALVLLSPGESLAWMNDAAHCNSAPETDSDAFVDQLLEECVEKIDISPDIVKPEEEKEKQTYRRRKVEYSESEVEKHVSPSLASESDADTSLLATPQVAASSKNRIKIVDTHAGMDKIGTCIHNIFAVYNSAGDEKTETERARKIIEGNGLKDAIPNVEEVVKSAKYIHAYLTETYGEGKMLRELPFTLRKNGRIISGEMDLVWETADGCVLVDYKNYPGSETSIMSPADDHWVGKYLPQLSIYKEALTKAGRKVLDTCIYYAVIGCIVKF